MEENLNILRTLKGFGSFLFNNPSPWIPIKQTAYFKLTTLDLGTLLHTFTIVNSLV